MAVSRGRRKIKILGNREFLFRLPRALSEGSTISAFDCIRGKGGTTAIILHLGARLRWVVGLKSWPLYPWFPLEGSDGSQSQPGHFGSRETSRAPTRNKTTMLIARPAASILYRLRHNDCLQTNKIMHFSVAFIYRIITVCFSLQSTKRRDWK